MDGITLSFMLNPALVMDQFYFFNCLLEPHQESFEIFTIAAHYDFEYA